MCAAHGVLEAVCPKCNPALAAVFQTKGDWCGEHGFPESFCPVCHPERGGRPAAAGTAPDDGAPADGTVVRLASPAVATAAGLATARAVARPGGARLEVLAHLSYDDTRRAALNARTPGVVRSLVVDVGTRVVAGAPLAVIDSAEVGADRSRLVGTAARIRVAQAAYDRERDLHAQGMTPLRDVQLAEQELASARARARRDPGRARRDRPRQGRCGLRGDRAPIAGTVVRRGATIGQQVDEDDLLFEIVDASALWVRLDVPEADALRVQAGQAVELTLDGAPAGAAPLTTTIAFLAPEVDVRTRTVEARATLPNPTGQLRANMFARATIALGDASPAVMVPRAAVQRAKAIALVFVQRAPERVRGAAGSRSAPAARRSQIEVRGRRRGGRARSWTTGSVRAQDRDPARTSIGAGCCADEGGK
jgi:cobalt-zinc-cadmium efflux system membrane fusion protein